MVYVIHRVAKHICLTLISMEISGNLFKIALKIKKKIMDKKVFSFYIFIKCMDGLYIL